MAKHPPRYTDALKMLEQHDSAVLNFTEKLAEGALGTVGVPELGGLIVRTGHRALAGIRGRLTGVSRYDRTQRIAAADRVLVTTACFEALGEVLDGPDAPLSLAELEIPPEEAQRLADSFHTGPRVSRNGSAVWQPGFGSSGRFLSRFLSELPTWRRLPPHERQRFCELLEERLPEAAARRYRELYFKLAGEVPEFGVWAAHAEHAATRETVGELATGLAGLERSLRAMSAGNQAERRAAELAAVHRRVLERPILRSADAPGGLTLPPLRDAYLAPRGRVSTTGVRAVDAEEAWEEVTVRGDISTVLAAHLTHPDAAERPMVILGHPGAGKSKLTEMLAARLPPEDFLAVRVELRSVQADAPIRRQVEQALSDTLHTEVDWRALTEESGAALPVVILDGLDELLQATGADRSDYLERVVEFQDTQETLGRPVAVIVTSRTVVADRLRFPDGCPVIRLEPFDDAQIARLTDIWNDANTDGLFARGLEPLPPQVALEHRELAEQPLLLFMLLLYDADANALQRAGSGLSRADLYERLLTSFAQREVAKHEPHLGGADLEHAVEEELRRLETTALAMFARRRQYVTAEELDRDLHVLAPPLPEKPGAAGMHGRLSGADRVLGRFFFVHESRARQSTDRSTYEFLHATFGEYLVARFTVATVRDLVQARADAARRRTRTPLDDGPLHAITSFAVLAGRAAAVEFTDDLLRSWFADRPEEHGACRELLLDLFHEAPFPGRNRSLSEYEPARLPVTARQGVYTANLSVLIALVCTEIDVAELFPGAADPWHAWRGLAGLWRGLPGTEWYGMLQTLRVRHLGYGGEGEPRTVLAREGGEPVNVGECIGFELRSDVTLPKSVADPYALTVPFEGVTSALLRSMALRAGGAAGRMVLMLLPYLAHVDTDLSTWFTDDADPREPAAWARAHDLLELRLAPPLYDPAGRLGRYRRLLEGRRTLGPPELLVLTQAADDLDRAQRSGGVGMDGFAADMAGLLLPFLRELESLAEEPHRPQEAVAEVLHRLRPHVAAAVLDHVEALVRHGHPDTGTGGPSPGE